MILTNRIVLLLRVSGGIWPCETPATAFSDVPIPTVCTECKEAVIKIITASYILIFYIWRFIDLVLI